MFSLLSKESKDCLMVQREMITMMVDTLPVFFYEKLVGYMPSSFADLVFAGERIEVGLKRGKRECTTQAMTVITTSFSLYILIHTTTL